MDNPRCRLYLISPPDFDIPSFTDDLEAALSGGDAACLQLRMKGVSDTAIVQAAEALMPICHAHGAEFLINDHADIAKRVGADGVHLGQTDGNVKDARRLLGPDASIGVTCHNSKHLAFEAGEAGADYVAFGAFFPTATKQTEYSAGLDLLTEWSAIAEIPCVAIGGITVENCAPLIGAGADFLAVSSGVWDYRKGPKQAITDFNTVIESAIGPNAD